jgi:hypothetical protein
MNKFADFLRKKFRILNWADMILTDFVSTDLSIDITVEISQIMFVQINSDKVFRKMWRKNIATERDAEIRC